MKGNCICGEHFRDAEDYRDHLPCPGSPEEQAVVKERSLIVKYLKMMHFEIHKEPIDYAFAIERCEHHKLPPDKSVPIKELSEKLNEPKP